MYKVRKGEGHKVSGSAEGERGLSGGVKVNEGDPGDTGDVFSRSAMTLLVIFGGLTERSGLGCVADLKREEQNKTQHINTCSTVFYNTQATSNIVMYLEKQSDSDFSF